MPNDSICLAKKCLDPSAVNHFSIQLLDSAGETAALEFVFELALPRLKFEPGIGGFWVSYP